MAKKGGQAANPSPMMVRYSVSEAVLTCVAYLCKLLGDLVTVGAYYPPDVTNCLAIGVACLLVLVVVIEGHAIDRHLGRAIVRARDRPQFAGDAFAGIEIAGSGHCKRRPLNEALARAAAHVRTVLIK